MPFPSETLYPFIHLYPGLEGEGEPPVGRYETAVLGTSGLKSFWPLDESSGAAIDVFAAHNGTASAEGLTRAQGSLLPSGEGASCKFDGAKGGFEIANHADLEIADTVSFEFWANVTSSAAKKDVLTLGTNSGAAAFEATTNKLTLVKQGVANVRNAKTAPGETAKHFVITKSGATTKLYENGVEVESEGTNATLEKSAAAKFIGRYSGGEFFKGSLQYLAVYNAVLSAATIAEHYAAAAKLPPPAPPALPPPATLSVAVTTASGQSFRWGPDEWNSENIPQTIQFDTAMPGGFKTATITLPRRIDRDYPDLNLLDNVQIIGPGNETVWEGRVQQLPRSHGETFSITVGAVGWGAHLIDDPSFRENYVSRDLSEWQQMSRARRLTDIAASRTPSDGQVAADSSSAIPGIVLPISGNASTVQQICEMMFDGGAGVYIGSIYYDFVRGTNSTSSYESFLGTDDADTFPSTTSTANLSASGASTGTLTAGASERYGQVYLKTPAGDGGTEGLVHDVTFRHLAVFGAHGLTKHGEVGEEGYLASDIIANVVARAAPLLNFSTGAGGSIGETSFPIPHLVFRESTTAEDVLKMANGYHLWDWGVWEGRQFFYAEPDPERLTWVSRLSEGAQLDLEGSQVDDVYNGVLVQYSDPAGTSHTVGPAGSGADATSASLEDTSATNPVNAHGIPHKWAVLSISQTTTEAGAIQLGSIFLGERSLPQRRGSLTITGTAVHPLSGPRPAWAVRAGDWVRIPDHPTDTPRKIIETSYDVSSQAMTCSLDNTSQKLDAILERMGIRLVGTL